jgi:hypothetical protein
MPRDPIAEALVRLLEHASGLQRESNRIELEPPRGGLPMKVQWSEHDVSVTLWPSVGDRGAWHHAWSLDGEDETASEVLDLVAAVAFGHARVVVHLRAGEPVRWDTEFLVGDVWLRHASLRAGRWRTMLAPRAVEISINHVRVPEPVVLGTPGRLPSAPWVGMLRAAAGDEPGVLEVDGVLDLHPFSPKEVKPLVEAYIEACLERGITELRIIHGKGIGNLRRTVHALLRKHPAVVDFRLGGHAAGSWGATIVDLRSPDR